MGIPLWFLLKRLICNPFGHAMPCKKIVVTGNSDIVAYGQLVVVLVEQWRVRVEKIRVFTF
jgi:hypothetical protein